MLSEYAVEPAAIGADWNTFRYLIEKFGADKGRLISRFPNKWERKVIQAAKDAGLSGVKLASVVERLHSGRHKVAGFNRTYNHETSWVDNAIREHGHRPFRAIVCGEGAVTCVEALAPDDCFDENAFFNAPISRDVARTSDDIAEALLLIALVADEIDIVDPYFDLRPARGNYTGPLTSLLGKLAAATPTPKVIKVNFRSHDSRPPPNILAQNAPALTNGILPQGYSLELYEWTEVLGGEDLHDRFFLTDVGGLMVGAGLAAVGAGETATFTLLDNTHAQQFRSRFSSNSTVYNRVGSAVRIHDDGSAELF
ncbi:hypothetical protein FDK21_11720 [Cohaesibacter sp. CAU 1516]|uniref:hypothetical protein n=1 Tax=Cohaesibacter sp. CAU 1516 TaxID=2576038 RepID=UPI0010FE2B75|nr:hypothetical protein [Cohaesibacter sp. CAU 1516]TLP45424.1 hypothetical protein FDK21_11720 [Cohaesibacter sp. CAU 1516]